MGTLMYPRSDEMRFDPVVWGTALFGIIAAVVLVTAI
jgi:hypothetical protein